MIIAILSVIAFCIQAYATTVALRLVTITRHRLAWGSITAAFTLILLRRVYELAAFFGLNDFVPNPTYTIISFLVSICIAVGMHLAKRMIDSMLENTQELSISEAYYRGLIEFGTEAIFVVDANGNYVNASPRGLELIGYTHQQLAKFNFREICDPDEMARLPLRMHMLTTEDTYVSRRTLIRGDGSRFVGELHTRRLPNGYLMASVRDITAHVEAQSRLQFQANMLDTVQQVVLGFDLDGRIIYHNQYAADLYGWHDRNVLGCPVQEVLSTDLTDSQVAQINACLESGQRWTGEIRYRDSENNWNPAMLIQSPLFDSNHTRIGSIGVSFDLSELQAAEQTAARAEHLLREFIDTAPFGAHHYELTSENRLVFSGANQTAERILHFDQSTIIGKTIEEAFPGVAGTPIPDIYRSVASTGVPWESSQIRYSDGVIDGAFEVSAFQTGPRHVVALFKDITDRVRSEEALRQREIRLQIVNDIARGISSHDSVESVIERALISIFQAFPKYRVSFSEVTPDGLLTIRKSLQPSGRATLAGKTFDMCHDQEYYDKLKGGQPIFVSSVAAIEERSPVVAFLTTNGIASFTSAPITLAGQTTGVLTFDHQVPTEWSEHELRLLVEVAGYLEIVFRDALQSRMHADIEEQLRVSDARFRMALRNSPVVMFQQDTDLRYTWNYNPRNEAANSFLIGKTDHDIMPDEIADRLTRIKREVLDTGVGCRFESEVHYQGQDTYWDVTLEPLRDNTGRIIGISGASTNITERKRAEEALRESEERYRALVESMPMKTSPATPENSRVSSLP